MKKHRHVEEHDFAEIEEKRPGKPQTKLKVIMPDPDELFRGPHRKMTYKRFNF